MTVVAWDGHTLAADTAVWQDALIVGHVDKIWRLSDGSMAGAAGMLSDIQKFRAWSEAGFPSHDSPTDLSDFGGIHVATNKTVRSFSAHPDIHDGLLRSWIEPLGAKVTFGAAEPFILGAMAAGATAAKAVALAIELHDSAGGTVRSLRLKAELMAEPESERIATATDTFFAERGLNPTV